MKHTQARGEIVDLRKRLKEYERLSRARRLSESVESGWGCFSCCGSSGGKKGDGYSRVRNTDGALSG